VVWRYVTRGTHQGALLGVLATGKHVEFTGTATLRLAGGKIAEIWDNVDMLTLYQQLGAVPPTATRRADRALIFRPPRSQRRHVVRYRAVQRARRRLGLRGLVRAVIK